LSSQQIKPRILVVDDEPVIADTLAIILSKQDYDVRTAYSGTQALQRAVEFKPDLMISDVMMPDVNGIEVATHVRELLPQCRILLFSGKLATAELLMQAQGDDNQFEILSKPIHPDDLLAKLRE
jgi:DNA-binding response OmpR family regulator